MRSPRARPKPVFAHRTHPATSYASAASGHEPGRSRADLAGPPGWPSGSWALPLARSRWRDFPSCDPRVIYLANSMWEKHLATSAIMSMGAGTLGAESWR